MTPLPSRLGTSLAVLLAVALPRLAALGSYPHMDEGFYAFISQYIHNGFAVKGAFPQDLAGFQLYSFLLSFLSALPGESLIWFRLADLGLALLAGWLFCRMLIAESGSLAFGAWLGFGFLLALNVPDAIDAGFKHSFFPAFAALFAAVNLARKTNMAGWRWFWSGILTALAVLLRETFAPFALLGCIALLCSRDFGALWRYICGGIAGAAGITGICAAIRGQFWEIFAAYVQAAAVYGPEAARVWPNFLEFGWLSIKVFLPLLILSLFCLWLFYKQTGFRPRGRALFWLAAAFLPILEPFFKLGFLYHFSVSLPGLAGFCAYAYSRIGSGSVKTRRAALAATVICACLMLPQMTGHFKNIRVSMAVASSLPRPHWPADSEKHSQTLAIAESIKRHMPKNGSLAANGFTFFLFPASGQLPEAMWQADLARTYIASNRDSEKLKDLIDRQSPDVAIIAEAVKPHAATFAQELGDIFSGNPHYRLLERIEPDFGKNYGWLRYSLYGYSRKGGNKHEQQ